MIAASRREGWAAFLLLATAALGAAVLFWANPAGGAGTGWRGLPLDDGWIHLVYARSVATTLRPDYNPGQLESGMTSPLWVGVNALAYPLGRALGLEPAAPPKLLSLGFGIAAAFLVYRIARRRTLLPALAIGAGLLLCLDPAWVFSTASGMEVTLFAASALLAVDALDRRAWSTFGPALGATVLARPEGLVLVAIALPLALLRVRQEPRPAVAGSWILLPLILPVAAWVVFNLHVSGRPLPNTFYVKAQGAKLFRGENLAFLLRRMVLGAPLFRTWIGVALAFPGAAWLLWQRKRVGDLVLAAFPFAFLYGLSMTHEFQQSEPYYWARYVHPVWPFLLLLVVSALAFAFDRIPGLDSGRRPLRWLIPTLALAVLAVPGALSLPGKAALFARNCNDIERANVHMGKWLHDHAHAEDWVATMDAGAVRFWSERPVLDIVGLNNGELLRDHDLKKLVLKVRPAWFVLFPEQSPFLVETLHLEPMEEVENGDYSICDCPSQKLMVAYRVPWNSPR